VTAAKRRIRRSRPSLWARVRTFWLLALTLAVPAGYGGYRLVTAPVFHLKTLTVTGLARVSRSQVFDRAAIDPLDNVWLLDRTAIRRRIEAIPYVASARVHVALPASVWLEVTERTPDGCVRETDGRGYTVDAALRVLEPGCTDPAAIRYIVRAKLGAQPGTFLRDPELVLLQRDARALAATGDRYRSFEHDSYGDLEATLSDGIDVEFGDDGDLALKQRLIGPILAELGPRANDVRAVDLRAPAAPVVEYRAALPSPKPAP
jgi:cell division septal protein FtsQ